MDDPSGFLGALRSQKPGRLESQAQWLGERADFAKTLRRRRWAGLVVR